MGHVFDIHAGKTKEQHKLSSRTPPFGLVTISALNIAAFLILNGIYNSAKLVSSNDVLRKSIRKYAMELRLLGLMGDAEIESEIQKTVSRDHSRESIMEIRNEEIELDKNEVRKYLDLVLKETEKSAND